MENLEIINTIGVVVVGIILIYQKYISGSSSLRKEIAEEYKERNTQLKEDVDKLTKDVTQYRLENAKLVGAMEEMVKQNKMLTDLLQGKNPEMIQLLADVKQTNMAILDFMKEIKTAFDSLKTKGV